MHLRSRIGGVRRLSLAPRIGSAWKIGVAGMIAGACVLVSAMGAVAGPYLSIGRAASERHLMLPGPPDSTLKSFDLEPGPAGFITIEVKSLDFDAGVGVSVIKANGEAETLADDDDGGVGMNSLLLMDAAADAHYRIEVWAVSEDWGGEFEITTTVGKIHRPEGESRRTQENEYWRQALERSRAHQNKRRQVRVLSGWAQCLMGRKAYEDAERRQREAIELQDEIAGGDNAKRIGPLVELAKIHIAARSRDQARKTFQQAIDLSKRQPSVSIQARVLEWYAGFLIDTGDYAGARPILERGLELVPDQESQTGRSASGPVKSDLLWRLGIVQEHLGRTKEAENSLKRSVSSAETIRGPGSEAAATFFFGLSQFYERNKRLKEAESAALSSMKIYERTNSIVKLSYPLRVLGRICESQNRLTEAEAYLKRAVELLDKELGPRTFTESGDCLADALRELGELYRRLGRYREAEPLLERATTVGLKTQDPDSLKHADALRGLASLYFSLSRYEEAEALDRRSLEIREEILGPDAHEVANSLDALGVTLHWMNQNEKALPLLERCLSILEKIHGPDDPEVASAVENLGRVLEKLGQSTDAEAKLKQALDMCERSETCGARQHALFLNDLGVFYAGQGRYDEAEPLYRRSLEIHEASLGPRHSETATACHNLANVLLHKQELSAAEALEERALKIRKAAFGVPSVGVADSLKDLGIIFGLQDHLGKAERYIRRALEMRTITLGATHPSTQFTRALLADLLREMNREDDARKLEADARP